MRTYVLAALAVASLLGLASQAQPLERYYPLAVGDTWTHERLFLHFPGLTEFRGYRRVAIVADTTIGGAAYQVATVEHLTPAQAVESAARCAVRVAPAGQQIEWVDVRGACDAFEDGLSLEVLTTGNGTYFVAGQPYAGSVLQTAAGTPARAVLAETVGPVETASRQGQDEHTRLLLGADVGGVALGEAPSLTAWRAFFPLSVGSRWAYRTDYTRIYPSTYQTVQVTGETAVEGVTYQTVQVRDFDQAFVLTAEREAMWRHDDARGCVVERSNAGVETCRTSGIARARTLVRERTVTVGETDYVARAIYEHYSSQPSQSGDVLLAEGIGLVLSGSNSGGSGGGVGRRTALLYARADGATYGTSPPWEAWQATAGEVGPAGSAPLRAEWAGPNPTAGSVRLRVTAERAAAVEIAVYDGLGRQVSRTMARVGPGGQTLTVDLGGQPAGVYVVRLTTNDGGEASVRATVY